MPPGTRLGVRSGAEKRRSNRARIADRVTAGSAAAGRGAARQVHRARAPTCVRLRTPHTGVHVSGDDVTHRKYTAYLNGGFGMADACPLGQPRAVEREGALGTFERSINMSSSESVLDVGLVPVVVPSVSPVPIPPPPQRWAIPLGYRVLGKDEWQRGITISISESGMLLEAAHPIPLRTQLELSFQLPERIGSLESGDVQCVGEVIRHGLPTPSVPYPIGVQFVRLCRQMPSCHPGGSRDQQVREPCTAS